MLKTFPPKGEGLYPAPWKLMRIVMDNPLRNSFRIQIKSLYLFEFQNFITNLFMFRYGAENYIPPREIKDKGADGIIVNKNTVVACYGPKKIDKNKYLKKIKDDFKLYSEIGKQSIKTGCLLQIMTFQNGELAGLINLKKTVSK
jgi:hypothetical protein